MSGAQRFGEAAVCYVDIASRMMVSTTMPCLGKLRQCILFLLFRENCGESSWHGQKKKTKQKNPHQLVLSTPSLAPKRTLSWREIGNAGRSLPLHSKNTEPFKMWKKRTDKMVMVISLSHCLSRRYKNCFLNLFLFSLAEYFYFPFKSGYKSLPVCTFFKICP